MVTTIRTSTPEVPALERAVGANPVIRAILERVPSLALPGWYLGAGCVAQTVWNQQHGFEPTFGIRDYDLVYFAPDDLSATTEHATERRVKALVADLDVKVDVKNEARVHLWYAERFGRSIPPYRSSEDAIGTWPTTATSVGIRPDGGGLAVCAPFGLSDLFEMVVRPNKMIISRQVYEAKATRWAVLWPRLTVLPW